MKVPKTLVAINGISTKFRTYLSCRVRILSNTYWSNEASLHTTEFRHWSVRQYTYEYAHTYVHICISPDRPCTSTWQPKIGCTALHINPFLPSHMQMQPQAQLAKFVLTRHYSSSCQLPKEVCLLTKTRQLLLPQHTYLRSLYIPLAMAAPALAFPDARPGRPWIRSSKKPTSSGLSTTPTTAATATTAATSTVTWRRCPRRSCLPRFSCLTGSGGLAPGPRPTGAAVVATTAATATFDAPMMQRGTCRRTSWLNGGGGSPEDRRRRTPCAPAKGGRSKGGTSAISGTSSSR